MIRSLLRADTVHHLLDLLDEIDEDFDRLNTPGGTWLEVISIQNDIDGKLEEIRSIRATKSLRIKIELALGGAKKRLFREPTT